MKKKNEVLIIQKYKGSLKGTISMLITLIISVICYIIVLYLGHNGGLNDNIQVSIIMIRDVLLAIISIVGTTLLTSLFIEKNRKNIDYTELLANDIFASPEFYSNLTEENKEKMFTYLSENFQNKDPVRNEVYNIIRDNLFSDKHIYYYEDFDESTSYYDYGNYSEKRRKE